MKKIFLGIVERLKAVDWVLQEEGHRPVLHFDVFNNQYNREEEDNPFPCTAVFVEMTPDYTDQGRNTQHSTTAIRLHVCQESYAHSADGSPNQEEALQVLDFVDLVGELVHGYELQGVFGKLQRRRVVPEVNASNLHVHIIEFTCGWIATGSDRLRKYQLTEGDGNLNLSVNLVDKVARPVPVASAYQLP